MLPRTNGCLLLYVRTPRMSEVEEPIGYFRVLLPLKG